MSGVHEEKRFPAFQQTQHPLQSVRMGEQHIEASALVLSRAAAGYHHRQPHFLARLPRLLQPTVQGFHDDFRVIQTFRQARTQGDEAQPGLQETRPMAEDSSKPAPPQAPTHRTAPTRLAARNGSAGISELPAAHP